MNTAIEWIVSNLRANVILLVQLAVKNNQSNAYRRRMILLEVACSELFVLILLYPVPG